MTEPTVAQIREELERLHRYYTHWNATSQQPTFAGGLGAVHRMRLFLTDGESTLEAEDMAPIDRDATGGPPQEE